MKTRHLALFMIVLSLAAGCAAPAKKEQPIVFYPVAPDLPRLQFLKTYTGQVDVEKERSAFDAFIMGAEMKVRLDKPYGAAIYDGKIYVADSNRTVMVFDLKNKTFGTLKGAQGLGKLVQPLNVSVDAEGNKYVTDPIRNQVVVFNKDDEYARSYAMEVGSWKPIDAVAYEDRIYVADLKNSVIRVFDKKSGSLVKTFGNVGPPEEQLGLPENLAFDKTGNLYVTDAKRFQVVKYDRDGHYLDAFGRLGTNLGHFARPRGVALDKEGRIYVADAAFSNVQLFSKDGYILLYFSGPGTRPGDIVMPAKVVVDYDNLEYFRQYIDPNFEAEYILLVTSQFGDSMVNVYAFGKERGKKYPTEEEALEEVKKKQKQFEKQPVPEDSPEKAGEKPQIPAEKQEKPGEKPAEKPGAEKTQ